MEPASRPALGAWLPVVSWAVVLFVLSAVPGDRYPDVEIRFADKMVHVLVYAVLGALCFRGFRRATRLGERAAVGGSALLGGLYGITDELHQRFVPHRSCDVYDGVADLIGATAGAAVMAAIARRGRRGSPP